MRSSKPPPGAQAFESHYAALFGARWPGLAMALQQPARRVLRLNGFASPATRELASRGLTPLASVPMCYELEPDRQKWSPFEDEQALCSGYVMDAASVLAAHALQVEPAHDVLDLCAAPGGKSLVLIEALGEGRLTVNDRSRARAQRLKTVLRQYLPRGVMENVRLTTHDARRWGVVEPEAYDRVLLDAPCSSERHVLTDRAELAKWSNSRIRRLAIEQYAMLASAARALRPGGKLVYSTCALTQEENDRVVARALEKNRLGLSLDSVWAPLGEPTDYGWQIHPDRHEYGPMYFARLVKRTAATDSSPAVLSRSNQ